MSLVSWWRVKRMRDPVDGSLLVTVCPPPESAPESAWYSAIVMGVVSGPDVAPRAVELHCTVPARRCPRADQTVPVVVDRADPDRVVVKWREVPVRRPLAPGRAATERRAAEMRRAAEKRGKAER